MPRTTSREVVDGSQLVLEGLISSWGPQNRASFELYLDEYKSLDSVQIRSERERLRAKLEGTWSDSFLEGVFLVVAIASGAYVAAIGMGTFTDALFRGIAWFERWDLVVTLVGLGLIGGYIQFRNSNRQKDGVLWLRIAVLEEISFQQRESLRENVAEMQSMATTHSGRATGRRSKKKPDK